MPVSRFESMLKTSKVYFFDASEFEHIIGYYIEIGKHSLAHKALKLGLEQHPSTISLKLMQVELLIFEDKLQIAVQLLSEIESLEPNNEEVFIQKATILSKKNNHKEAIATLKKSLNFADDPIDIWSLIGMEYLYLDDYENAKLNFSKCITNDYEDYPSLYNIIYCYEMTEDFDGAIDFLNNYIDTNPYCEIAWHQLGRQHYTLNQYEQALKAFDYAVLIDESFIGGYLEKAKTLEYLEQYEKAIENYMITLELDDPTAFAYLRIGQCYEKTNSIDYAVLYYQKAINEDPLLDKAWIYLTDIFYQKQDYNKALYYINNALKIDNSNSLFWRKLANINIQLNWYEEAEKALYQCILLKDSDIEVYVALIDVLMFLGEYTDALKILIDAKKLYPNFAEIEYRLCGVFMKIKDEENALKHLKTALSIDFEYHKIIKDLYPVVFETQIIKDIIYCYK